jgi:hypothetical protein
MEPKNISIIINIPYAVAYGDIMLNLGVASPENQSCDNSWTVIDLPINGGIRSKGINTPNKDENATSPLFNKNRNTTTAKIDIKYTILFI